MRDAAFVFYALVIAAFVISIIAAKFEYPPTKRGIK